MFICLRAPNTMFRFLVVVLLAEPTRRRPMRWRVPGPPSTWPAPLTPPAQLRHRRPALVAAPLAQFQNDDDAVKITISLIEPPQPWTNLAATGLLLLLLKAEVFLGRWQYGAEPLGSASRLWRVRLPGTASALPGSLDHHGIVHCALSMGGLNVR